MKIKSWYWPSKWVTWVINHQCNLKCQSSVISMIQRIAILKNLWEVLIIWNSNNKTGKNKYINYSLHFPTFWSFDIAVRWGPVARDTTLMAKIPSSIKDAFAAWIKDASRKPWGGQLISKLIDTIPQHHSGMEHCHWVPVVINNHAYEKKIEWQKTIEGHFTL